MKTRGIYALVDKKLEDATEIFMRANDLVAARDYEEYCKKIPEYIRHPEDYCLIKVGEIDENLKVTACKASVVAEAETIISTAKEEAKKAKENSND